MAMIHTGGPTTERKHQNESQARIKNYISYAVLLTACVLLFVPLISSLSAIGGDYKLHLQWAGEIETSHIINLPHPLYHILAILVKTALATNYIQASTIVIVASIFFLAILNYRILLSHTSPSIATAFSLSLLIITPIQLFYFTDHHLYFGYIGISIYHSPTMLLLKPLSLLVFYYTLKSSDGSSINKWPIGVALALSLFFCGISKPNFLIVVLPAFLAFLLLTGKFKLTLSRAHIYLCFFLPILTVLSLQFFQTFVLQDISKVTKDAENHIVFMPFETVSHYSSYLLPKLLLSITFPLSIFLLYPKQYIKDNEVIFALLCLFIGATFMYFFAESGGRMYHGNFWWSGQIGLYLTFLFSVSFLLKNFDTLTRTRYEKTKYAICFCIFFLHFLSGVFFYNQELFFYSKHW
ncbi:hypothetical protein [Pseudomonas fluorescens]|uniref:Glycosyltransferase RgtA/B/C/D-like domain-containing protein n=1 Tax=Pseudomonas fluorescens TaxID=294 RepID=A0A5E6TMN5_PSEFL|nr:hypothetical protein [Pseudomonas fluorescens]VVM93742.1 hypothetical protein PS655_02953 [Pseudomonas fluorescens]